MLKNPQDRRAQRTATQIKETMLTFLETKAIHDVRVSDICKVCQINRATFYDHYRDVFDLVHDLEGDILTELGELMEAVSPEHTPDDEVSRLFFDFLSQRRKTLLLLIQSERGQEFLLRLDKKIMPFFEEKIRQNYLIPEGRNAELQTAMEFAAMGYYRFFLKTLSSSHREILREAEFCARLSDACLQVFFSRKA